MLRFAVIGQGHIGKRHAEMIRRNTQTHLVSVCDILPASEVGLSDISEPYYQDVTAMLAAEQVDVVCICTPNGLHASHALEALAANCHIVVEKPFALTQTDGARVIQKAKEHGKKLFCVMQNRYSPPAVWLKELVSSNKLGQIYAVQLNCLWNRDERYYSGDNWHGTRDMDGGTLFTQFSHFIDIMYWLFGDITDIHAVLRDFNHQQLTDFEDSGFVTFRFTQHNAIGTLTYSTALWDSNMESSLTILAEHGSVRVAGQYMNEVSYCHVKDYTLPTLAPVAPPNDYGAYKGSAQNHHYVIQNVVDALCHNTPITTSAEEGLKVVEIIERIYNAGHATHS